MFHWICPECGQEIAPGVKECPVCEPGSTLEASPSPLPFSSPAVAAAPALAPIVEQPLPAPPILLEPEIVLQPEVVLQPQVIEKPEPQITPQALPDADDAAPPEPETFADRLADLAEQLHGERVPYAAQRIIPSTATTRPHVEREAERAPVILDVTPARPLLAPPPSMRLLAEPQPPSVAAGIPARQAFRPRAAEHPIQLHPPMGAEPSAPAPVRLPDRPGREAAPALAPLHDYYQAADRQMHPASYASPAAMSSVELNVTLPGPALPRELMSLQAAGLVPIEWARRDAAATGYAWMAKMAVAAILLTAGVGYWVLPGGSPSAPAKTAPQPPPVQAPIATKPANSLARLVEVTGVRFLEVNKKPQIRYLVVNHSSAPLGSVMVYVTLRAIDAKPGQPPLARLTFRSPDLAAFEAKEMASPIEGVSGHLDLPDWQDLHADVDVQ